ncbi:hypothetical protein A2313_03525 [Candidatus Roizmanbacteria bacterium RIFOXYB2_FULL_41_10]|uniref:Uncharacterized protein n=1 Tax=Candidatus Roizmanbacteria bacterium RIFOXYA1_FULL_41_12 TaxID=1802082 RepID=A0A1F7KEP2_9BACT|nr:MAG: hypothetical protein A2209_02145 [Candidatus Roizmanbacteria bacterium RIFOXYA1_FULL_41_12]OGK67132.1 MAG: hypothetical protein A2377_00535 [Candidatus Roizmanbacteria bacterium RIFOXYB1_FULL_41_27]OGK68121.1 MAG: hypothetical protein A2262_00535 [Candidatus Roizmanbacteria bacterium RIFOXYA2_FULL_41_8]OGK69007.1 MAG: hypothetical protein A2313_03525 [Candidatus Roizmanbacteria bacterium RIFOXYB2_FULL_41_10]OGK71537.1 MAG: hypothetical protein A2403_00870 [Candidatus Roizmanbacteria bac
MVEIIKRADSKIYSFEPVYIPVPHNLQTQPKCRHILSGIGPVIDLQPCVHPFVFHALVRPPTGEHILSRAAQKLGSKTKGHEGYVFSYTVPKNNITAFNDNESPERQEMKEIVGESFYNLVVPTKFGQRVIRMGSAYQDGYLAILKGSGFQKILRLGSEGGASYYYVYQAVKERHAEIHDVIEIEGSTSHRIYGFYHFPDFEYVQGLVGLTPIQEYLKQCSSRIRGKLTEVANTVYKDTPLPLPARVAECVMANRNALN